jgi:hypothetical protein
MIANTESVIEQATETEELVMEEKEKAPDDKSPLTCECGRSFTTTSGLSNHKKKCGGTPEKPVKKLTSTEKQNFARLISRRQDTILRAMNDEFKGDKEEAAFDLIRREKGLVFTPSQLKDMLTAIDEQIDAEKAKHLKQETMALDIKRTETIEGFEERETEMKLRHKEEYRALKEEKNKALEALRAERVNIEQETIKKYAGPLLEKKIENQAKLAQATQIEMEVQAEARQRLAIIKQSKGRMEHAIRDATGRALEKLAISEITHKEALELLDRIPTAAEAIKMCSSVEGIEALFFQLNPDMPKPALPAPTITDEQKAEALKEIIDKSSEEDDDEDDIEDAEWRRAREVYRDTNRG